MSGEMIYLVGAGLCWIPFSVMAARFFWHPLLDPSPDIIDKSMGMLFGAVLAMLWPVTLVFVVVSFFTREDR